MYTSGSTASIVKYLTQATELSLGSNLAASFHGKMSIVQSKVIQQATKIHEDATITKAAQQYASKGELISHIAS